MAQTEALVFDAHYPQPEAFDRAQQTPQLPLQQRSPRDQRFAIVEILWSPGRSVQVKKQMLQHLVQGLRRIDHDPEQLMLVFKETAWENWSFAGGRLLHA